MAWLEEGYSLELDVALKDTKDLTVFAHNSRVGVVSNLRVVGGQTSESMNKKKPRVASSSNKDPKAPGALGGMAWFARAHGWMLHQACSIATNSRWRTW